MLTLPKASTPPILHTQYSILSAYICTFAQAAGRFALLHEREAASIIYSSAPAERSYGERMSQRPLGFGIWGTGMIAEFHAKALAEIAGVKLVAAYNRTPAKGREFAAKHGITFAETPEA